MRKKRDRKSKVYMVLIRYFNSRTTMILLKILTSEKLKVASGTLTLRTTIMSDQTRI